MKYGYPICTPGAPVGVPRMTGWGIRDAVAAAGAVVMKGCECGGRFERVDDIVADTVVDGERVVVRHLHGHRCVRCWLEVPSPESMRTINAGIRETTQMFDRWFRRINMGTHHHNPSAIFHLTKRSFDHAGTATVL